jgi:putative DNA primase/helicase
LDEITDHDKQLQKYLQRVCGYLLTGDVSEHAVFFLYGTGANGKSVFVKTIAEILRDYSRVASMETFMMTHNPTHPTDLAGHRGARLVIATELEDGQRWAEAKLKQITGGEPITARLMRQDFFQFTPQFKPVLSGNHQPKLLNVDEAMRRRIHLIPFQVTIPPNKRDPKLAEALRAEWGGILLRWAVDGCLAWQRDKGLRQPEAVEKATTDYFESEDTLGNWIRDRCVEGGQEKRPDLYSSYCEWADVSGLPPYTVLTVQRFAQKLRERRYRTKRISGTEYVVGLTRRSSSVQGSHRLLPVRVGAEGAVVPITALRVLSGRSTPSAPSKIIIESMVCIELIATVGADGALEAGF